MQRLTNHELKEELLKAKKEFDKWPEWKKYVLRNSMRGYVTVPRVPIKRD